MRFSSLFFHPTPSDIDIRAELTPFYLHFSSILINLSDTNCRPVDSSFSGPFVDHISGCFFIYLAVPRQATDSECLIAGYFLLIELKSCPTQVTITWLSPNRWRLRVHSGRFEIEWCSWWGASVMCEYFVRISSFTLSTQLRRHEVKSSATDTLDEDEMMRACFRERKEATGDTKRRGCPINSLIEHLDSCQNS